MNVGIYGRLLKEEHIVFVQQLVDELLQHNFNICLSENYLQNIKNKISLPTQLTVYKKGEDVSKIFKVLITLGGDGTFLDTVNIVKNLDVKILGINLGRLGFLATISKKEIKKAIEYLKEDKLIVDERTVLMANANKPLFENENYSLNEFTIYKRDASTMITVHTFVNNEFLTSYWADGIIISTPTGSTAYSLSCGGPIIEPSSENFVITPIAPHNLNVRPFVVNDNKVLTFEIESRNAQLQCALDSRSLEIDNSYKLTVSKADFKLQILKMPDDSFLNTLRAKLFWGQDSRFEKRTLK